MLRLLVEPCKDNTFYRISHNRAITVSHKSVMDIAFPMSFGDSLDRREIKDSITPSAKPQLQRTSEIRSEQMKDVSTTSLNQAESDEIMITSTTTITPTPKTMTESTTVEQDG